ncbi:hypothetical protein LDVICp018 [lymphocystis disease virus-China]|uniref:Uncharacterized protein n=2 Tax=Lymphocystis disease virus 2 TaxID=159183 RepID=A0A6F8WZV3_9VIRU|nr:hypothetical protein LDVICp018 [lymphocystis disease virus-China]AAU10866.1 hypothetical protein [lymphocystis disease virus-China]BCB67422.1 hypothetical protein [Lymphocystis disease virus 2]
MFKKLKFLKNITTFCEYKYYILIVLTTQSLTQEEFNYLDNLTIYNDVYLFHFKSFKCIYLNNF